MFKGIFNLKNIINLLIAILPVLLIICFIVFVVYLLKNHVKIKWRTFKGKGFRPVRGNFGVYNYCGKQGKGKTYSVVEYLLDNKDKIEVFCNIKGIKGIDYRYYTGLKELMVIKNLLDSGDLHYDNSKQLVIVHDEIFTDITQADKNLAKPIIDFLCQMRKRKIIFLTTCQEWAELPLSFRRFCRFQIDCNMKPFFWTGILIKTFHDAENMKWDNDAQDFIAPITETTITKCRKLVANSYDTFLRISSVSAPDPSTTGSGAAINTPRN